MNTVGIEKINLYGSSLYLDQRDLAVARGQEPEKVVSDFLIESRSVSPPWEDTVTMGANAALPMLSKQDLEDIGLLVVGTESSLDFGKPVSTNIHSALGLHPNVRNFETKHACYSGVAALDTAVNWIASGLNGGRKALVISTDFSRMHLNTKEEFVLGGVAAAALLSETPKVVEYETQNKGTWTTDAYDTFRPSAFHEIGNNEVSLFTYMDALEGAFTHYQERTGNQFNFDNDFSRLTYHTPFAGMAFQAHRTLCNLTNPRPKKEVKEDFSRRVYPGLRFAQRVGGTYGASNFVALCGHLSGSEPVKPGSRIGFFAYGSGAIGEFYSGTVCEEAVNAVASMNIDDKLASRRNVTVDQYEILEQLKEGYIEKSDFIPQKEGFEEVYRSHYQGTGKLVLKGVKGFYRTYERV
ncbi:MAG: hydroxymethylglutaryl-CoA synthase family protein [Spirochaetia bacterium]